MAARRWVLLAIGAAAWGAGWAASQLGWLARLENVSWDWRARRIARPSPATDRIRVILIDQASLDWARREMKLPWPWPREAYAPILDFCRRAGAHAVGLDLVFTEPSFAGVADDEAFGAALARAGNAVAAMFIGGAGDGDAVTWPGGVPRPPAGIEGALDWLAAEPARGVVRGTHAAFPIPEVATNAALLGNVSEVADADGIFRHATLFRVFDSVPVLSLGLSLRLAEARRDGGTGLPIRVAGGRFEMGGTCVAMDERARARLRFRGPSGAHRSYSAAAVIQSELRLASGEGRPVVDPGDFSNRFVLVGASAAALLDLRPTSVSRVYPGVEIHATALDNLLVGDFIRPAPRGLVGGLALVLCLSASLVAGGARRAWQMGMAIAAAAGVPAAGTLAAAFSGWEAPMVWPAAAAMLSGLGAALYNYASEGRQKAFIQRAFRHYLGPEVIEQILADPGSLRLGGERRTLTLLFSDIEKFSTFSERLEPPELARLLNEYLTEMGRVILAHGGYVDKYIGDAIVAFWNAPLAQPDHAARAVRAALACQAAQARRRAEWEERFGATVRTRIGLNTGDVVVGNLGSEDRFNYTVLGDAANLASRLEGANKFFGSAILASTAVREAAGSEFRWRWLGRVRVVGRATPTEVYEPLGLAADPAPPWWKAYEAAMALAEAGRYAEAASAFRAIPGDAVSALHAARYERLAAGQGAWDGVWNLTEK